MSQGHGNAHGQGHGGSSLDGPSIQVICLGSGGGPSEDNASGFLVRSTASKWAKGSVLAVDAGSHLAAIARILEQDFPRQIAGSEVENGTHAIEVVEDSPSRSSSMSSICSPGRCSRESTPPITLTTLDSGPFEGLSFPFLTASANAAHLVREHVSTYLITHPHLDHLSGFAINTAAFHNTSRPKKLAALPFTVNAIKAHIFNDLIWPNLTDEDGGVGFVTFQRLAEGGNIALGDGHSRGFIEVCDGLSVRAFKVSHGKAVMGPLPFASGFRRGSSTNNNNMMPDAVTPSHGHNHRKSHSHSHSSHSHHPNPAHGASAAASNPSGVNTPRAQDLGRRSSLYSQGSQPGTPTWQTEQSHVVVDSSAFFIRAESNVVVSTSTQDQQSLSAPSHSHHSHHSHHPHPHLHHPHHYTTYQPHSTEILVFGDVEPDSVSLSPRTMLVWAEAAPKIVAGILKGIFIECSYSDAQADSVLFGHMAPRHIIAELEALAEMVEKERKEQQHRRAERLRERQARKRKRASGLQDQDGQEVPESGKHLDGRNGRMRMSHSPLPESDVAMDAATQDGAHGDQRPVGSGPPNTEDNPHGRHGISIVTTTIDDNTPTSRGLLEGLKVVIIHVKESLNDGPPTGDTILKELRTHEARLRTQGTPLGCEFEIASSGSSYWF